MVQAEIVLVNIYDLRDAKHGIIKENQIRQISLTAIVDTGAITLVINEDIRQKLGLEIEGSRLVTLADGTRHTFSVTEPVNIKWKNRDTACRALLMPNSSYVLLGSIALEDMDLMVNPVKQELVGAHGDEAMCLVL